MFATACADRALDRSRDAGTALDDGVLFCGTTHTRTPVPLTELALVGGGVNFLPETTLRLQVSYPLRAGCDVPADTIFVPTSDDPSTASYTLTAYAWLGSEDCGGSTERTTRIPIPHLTANSVQIADGAPMGTAALMLAINPATPFCVSPKVPTGQFCVEDCDCADPAALCMNDADHIQRCGHPCNDDVDCQGAAEGGSCQGTPTFTCGAPPASCVPIEACGFGEVVESCVCTRPQPAAIPPGCGCDADCPTGTICNGQSCITPCTGNDSCPGPHEACAQGACILVIPG